MARRDTTATVPQHLFDDVDLRRLDILPDGRGTVLWARLDWLRFPCIRLGWDVGRYVEVIPRDRRPHLIQAIRKSRQVCS